MNMNNMFCKFIKIRDRQFECANCGNTIDVHDDIEEAPIVPCFSPILNYNASNIVDFMSNHKMQDELCSEQQIETRHNICTSCDFFQNNSCNKCGCSLTRDRNYLNKLALKNQSCPINKW